MIFYIFKAVVEQKSLCLLTHLVYCVFKAAFLFVHKNTFTISQNMKYHYEKKIKKIEVQEMSSI